MTAVATGTFSRLRDVDREEWDDLLSGPDYYLSSQWLAAAEATAADDPCAYVTCRSADGTLVAVTAAYLLSDSSPFTFCRPDVVLGAGGRFGPHPAPAGLVPGVSAGGRNPSHSRVALRAGLDADLVSAALTAVVAAVEEWARAQGARCCAWLYVDGDDHALAAAVIAAGYRASPSGEAAILSLPGRAFADYVAGLPASPRQRVRRDGRQLLEAAVRLEVVTLTPDLVPLMVDLESQLYAKYGTPYRPHVTTCLYTSLAGHDGSAAKVSLAVLDGEAVGFALAFRWRGVLHARCAGFAYERAGKLPVYFGAVYYSLVEEAYASGVRQIRYSTGLPAVKASRGCQLVPQVAFSKPLSAGRGADP